MENLPATQSAASDVVNGLEDFGVSDMVMPRLNIDHDTGKFVDSLSGIQYNPLECIVLGIVKARVLWHEDPDFDGGPLCRSLDGKVGIPSHRVTAPFPWAAANMNQADFPEGTGVLCETCPLSQWGSHPKNDTPWCTEQYKLPLLMEVAGGYSPAVLTLQRSGLGAIRGYATSFARTQTPMYTAMTTISLDLNKKGNRSFAVPKFAQGDATDQSLWPSFLEHYRRIRSFLVEPREDDSAPTPQVTPTPVQVSAPAQAPAQEPVPAPEPAQPVAQPVAPTPAQPVAQPAPQPVASEPVVESSFSDDDIGF